MPAETVEAYVSRMPDENPNVGDPIFMGILHEMHGLSAGFASIGWGYLAPTSCNRI